MGASLYIHGYAVCIHKIVSDLGTDIMMYKYIFDVYMRSHIKISVGIYQRIKIVIKITNTNIHIFRRI